MTVPTHTPASLVPLLPLRDVVVLTVCLFPDYCVGCVLVRGALCRWILSTIALPVDLAGAAMSSSEPVQATVTTITQPLNGAQTLVNIDKSLE